MSAFQASWMRFFDPVVNTQWYLLQVSLSLRAKRGVTITQLPHPPLGGSRVDERGGFFVAKTNTVFGVQFKPSPAVARPSQRAQRESSVSAIGLSPPAEVISALRAFGYVQPQIDGCPRKSTATKFREEPFFHCRSNLCPSFFL